MDNINKYLKPVDTTKLKHNYMDACSDKEFKKYLEALPISDDVLIKYTSSLEDAYKEYINCQKCSNLANCKNKIKGYALTPEKDHSFINFSYIACKKLEDELNTNKYQVNIALYETPKKLREASFKDIYKDDKNRIPIIKYFKDFMDKYKQDLPVTGLYLTGSFGSGKTYLIAALFNELAKRNVKSTIVYYPDFLRLLKASFQTNYASHFDYIKKSSLLLLDDIGAENETYWSRDEVLGPLLQYRMEEGLPTFFTSNLTLDELEQTFLITKQANDKVKARRLRERIEQLTVTLELVSVNRRK